MKMRKFLLTVLCTVCLFCTLSFTACGGKVVESLMVTNNKDNWTVILPSLPSGETVQLDVKIKYVGQEEQNANSTDVKYTSKNLEIATVNSNGLITIIWSGLVEIEIESVYSNTSGVKSSQIINIYAVNIGPPEPEL
jgi:uncharacterized protein YjdB